MQRNYNFIIALIWAFLAFAIFFSSMKKQVIIGNNFKKQINTVFPEGWGFFTKNPRDPLLKIYKLKNGKAIEVDASNHSLFNYFGLSRKARIVGYESSIMANEIDKKSWTKNKTNDIGLVINDSSYVLTERSDFNYLKEGEYIFKVHKPIPYAWSNKKQTNNYPITAIKVKIEKKND